MKLYANVECVCVSQCKPIRNCIGSFGHFTAIADIYFIGTMCPGAVVSVSCVLTPLIFIAI